jgi:hypothetical protein
VDSLTVSCVITSLDHLQLKRHIGKHIYRFRLLAKVHLHPVFHINNIRPCSTSSLRPHVPVTVQEEDDEEFDVSHIYVVCIKSSPRRRGKYLLLMTHFKDDDIPPKWHHRGSSNCGVTRLFGDALLMAQFCQDSGVHQLYARSTNAHSWVLVTTSEKEPRKPRRSAPRLASLICQKGKGTSVTSTILQQYIARQCTCARS